MSALLAGTATPLFNASIPLANGAFAHISAPSLVVLSAVVALLQPTEAANEPGKPATPNAAPAATAPAGSPASPTTAPSAPAAAAPAAQGDAGNAAAASPSSASAAASNASSSKPVESPAVSFDDLKKAFLNLSTKAGGREKCEGVLKPFGLPKLSAAAPEQYAAILAEIQKAAS